MTPKKIIFITIAAIVIIGGVFFVATRLPKLMQQSKQSGPPAPELIEPDGYINTDTIALADLIGKKVILLSFWTYSCINCLRTLPSLNAWYDKYQDKGLAIIGIHTPEFEFEKKYDNVAAAVKKYGIRYPVVQDNDYKTWRAYKNRFWPRTFLIDIRGNIVYDHIGEGAYTETEQNIRALLDERFAFFNSPERIAPGMSEPEGVVAVDAAQIGSPEIYFGAARNENLGNGARFTPGTYEFSMPEDVKTNQLYLIGAWTIEDEFAINTIDESRITLRYVAKNVYLVAGAGEDVHVTILRDGEQIDAAAGRDVRKDGTLIIQEEGLYSLIEDPDGYGTHTLEIIIDDPGLRAYTITFG